MTKIEYNGMTFSDENDQIISGEIYDAVSLISDVIEVGTFKAEVRVSSDADGEKLRSFKRNDQLLCFHNNRQLGVWYVENVERTSKYTYEISANNAVALLDGSKHYGGIYTGQTAGELIADICTIPHYVKPSMASQKLYGWLPAASRRSNLAQVLFAIGAYAWVDEVGLLRIGPLWDGVSNYIGEDSIKAGDKVKYASKITEVSVLEHTYAQGEEEVTLFDGTAASGDIITFNEPAHSLTASGVTILESGANYVKISAGSGTVTGKKYIHTTRDVRLPVSESDVENVKEVKTATLVSLANSMAVAQRLSAYYKCCETVQHDSVFHNQAPGAVISFNHPFDGDAVGCIKSTGIEIGAQKIISDEKIISGFLPPQPSNLEYYDARVVLTGEGDWERPKDVDTVTVVCIGGGTGGYGGANGQDGKKGGTSGNYGEGGLGGNGGIGGRIHISTIQLTDETSIPYHTGTGGNGGASNGGVGSEGGASVFGPVTSADGASSENGYTDIFTGDVFAGTGDVGQSGARGGEGGGVTASKSEDGQSIGDNVGGTGGSGRNYGGTSQYPGFSYGGGGGGAAIGGDGGAGGDGSMSRNTSQSTTTAYGGTGGTGGNAQPPAKSTGYGKGGTGGNGGGGGGGGGNAVQATKNYPGSGGTGGNGSIGGQGGDGCIILYYRIPKEVKSGSVMDKTGRFVLDRTGRLMVV